jgi:hypothetical protein
MFVQNLLWLLHQLVVGFRMCFPLGKLKVFTPASFSTVSVKYSIAMALYCRPAPTMDVVTVKLLAHRRPVMMRVFLVPVAQVMLLVFRGHALNQMLA